MTAKSAGEAGENPLVPNAKLRQMYLKMLEARALDDTAVKRSAKAGRKRISTIRGQEAIRVSTIIDLGEDDLVSDSEPTAGMGLLLGGDRAKLLRGLVSTKTKSANMLHEAGVTRSLGWTADEQQRLQLAVGAALALKTQQRRGIVVAYARKGETTPAVWRKILAPAAELALPILFVVLPRSGAKKKGLERSELCNVARAAGIPGIPVDACDPVALYRVTQESLGRTRGGDGPVLIESVQWRTEGTRGGVDDPLEYLKQFLLERRICEPKWFSRARRQKNG
jgi:TPP-dependent pyruvate/acetoin dehydrogenase alpha subunit